MKSSTIYIHQRGGVLFSNVFHSPCLRDKLKAITITTAHHSLDMLTNAHATAVALLCRQTYESQRTKNSNENQLLLSLLQISSK